MKKFMRNPPASSASSAGVRTIWPRRGTRGRGFRKIMREEEVSPDSKHSRNPKERRCPKNPCHDRTGNHPDDKSCTDRNSEDCHGGGTSFGLNVICDGSERHGDNRAAALHEPPGDQYSNLHS